MDRTHDLILNLPEYDHHHLVTFLHDESTGMEAFVAIHRKSSTFPSFGATRMWHYDSDTDALRDALRLSRLMSYKAALAGLPCGGAKGVIIDRGLTTNREGVLVAYADKINVLKDSFVTGTDVGINQTDLYTMKAQTPNIIGFNDNSTDFTVEGIYLAIECALGLVYSDRTVKNRSFAIQGLGKIGGGLLHKILKAGGSVIAADVDASAVSQAKELFPEVTFVEPSEIHKQKVDVFSPCAVGAAINTSSVAELSCRIVAGGANNQLENEEMGDILHKMGVLYAPDYVVNAGGLIAVFDEYESHERDNARVMKKVGKIPDRLLDILTRSAKEDRAAHRVANDTAESIFNSYGKGGK